LQHGAAAGGELSHPEQGPRSGLTQAEFANSNDLERQFANRSALITLKGEASYYGDALAGHPTASGEPYRPGAFTAAHRKLPLGTVLRVTRSDDGRSVYVRVNDRGPYGSKLRILDLSRAAGERLGMIRAGVVEVRAEVLEYGPHR